LNKYLFIQNYCIYLTRFFKYAKFTVEIAPLLFFICLRKLLRNKDMNFTPRFALNFFRAAGPVPMPVNTPTPRGVFRGHAPIALTNNISPPYFTRALPTQALPPERNTRFVPGQGTVKVLFIATQSLYPGNFRYQHCLLLFPEMPFLPTRAPFLPFLAPYLVKRTPFYTFSASFHTKRACFFTFRTPFLTKRAFFRFKFASESDDRAA